MNGLVDAYYGPDELRGRIDEEAPREPAALVEDARALLEALDAAGLDAARARWLRAQVIGLETVARKLGGEAIAYGDEVERCYGVRPHWVPESAFAEAHAVLDELVPGDAPLPERYAAWREEDALTGEPLARVMAAMAVDARARTTEVFGLPPDEAVEWDFVREQPWSAYNYYAGEFRSRVAINVDLPVRKSFVLELVTHEAYPGHHTEHAWKEQRLVRGRGWVEESILLIGTPQSLVSEGIAKLSSDLLFAGEADDVAARHLEAVGVAYDADLMRATRAARDVLEHVPTNAALLLHERGATADEAVEYLMRWGLLTEQRAHHALAFLTDPLWRSYVATYTDCDRLARAYVGGERDRFRRLLTEQLTTADLAASP